MHQGISLTSLARLAGIGSAAVLAAATLAGCSSGHSSPGPSTLAGTCLTTKPAPLVLAIGARSNVPVEKLPADAIELLKTAASAGQQISLIRIDGQPKIFTPVTFRTSAQNQNARGQALDNYLNDNIAPILQGKLHAQIPQADVLTALSLAAGAAGADGNIVLLDSGLQTTGALNYQQQGLLMSPPEDVVKFLRQENLLPDLRGKHVLLAGFGFTASPQPVLNEAQQKSLIKQWSAIVRAGGGCVSVDHTPNTGAEISGLPQVSAVVPPPTPTFGNCGTFKLEDAGTVGFVVGKAKFRDPPAADATLQKLADTLNQGTESIKLIGSTSTEGGNAVNNPLSLKRARAVETILVSMHVPASRITIKGDGSHWPGRVKDTGPNGVLLPGPAEQDREVIVQLPQCT